MILLKLYKKELGCNRLLIVHEVNKQVEDLNFRIRSSNIPDVWALLEDLSKLMEVNVEDNGNTTTGESTGFINICYFKRRAKGSITNSRVQSNSRIGIKTSLSSNGNGTDAKVHAKIDANGQLHFLKFKTAVLNLMMKLDLFC